MHLFSPAVSTQLDVLLPVVSCSSFLPLLCVLMRVVLHLCSHCCLTRVLMPAWDGRHSSHSHRGQAAERAADWEVLGSVSVRLDLWPPALDVLSCEIITSTLSHSVKLPPSRDALLMQGLPLVGDQHRRVLLDLT
jgi:hypothetical protein